MYSSRQKSDNFSFVIRVDMECISNDPGVSRRKILFIPVTYYVKEGKKIWQRSQEITISIIVPDQALAKMGNSCMGDEE